MDERLRSEPGPRGARRLLAALALLVSCGLAQAAPEEPAEADAKRAEYEQVTKEISLSSERLARLAADIAAVRKDYASITAALIQSAKTEQKLGQDIDDIGTRLEELKGQDARIRASLAERSDVLAEVLGALQRMGVNPPPAILVRPEDALASVRSAILLGAVVPELRHETERLMADLKEHARVTASIEAERGRLTASVTEQLAEKQRLTLLLEARKKFQAETQAALAAEQQNAQELAARARSLKDLIAALDKQAKRKAEEEARTAALPVPEANRLLERIPFRSLHGQIALPVTGTVKRRFGANDGNGSVMQGDMVATQSGAIVTAPADGEILYAGPFRSYGQLLILDAGGGYHVVLAGMNRLTVASGQSVLAGEPIGAMGEARVASTSATQDANATPELYVEFRKDGKPVDPTPWWADRVSGRT
ncbi:murein hydrolase activator EnvC family protein [Aquamicrobium terrae]|uniref:murein hydrolase activator EnvC family protein n=1 Tax=Aquamicrobium terrae TaxID=1324945 RepID=UPI00339B505F